MPYNIVVLGAGGVGKSVITIQYLQNKFVDEYYPTIADTYRKTLQIDNKTCTLQIMDCAGTEQFNSLRNSSIKDADAFLLVYSITCAHTFFTTTEIYEQIRLHGKAEIPMVVVGNKIDLEEQREVSMTEQEEVFPEDELLKTYEITAKNKEDVDNVFVSIVRMIKSMQGEYDSSENENEKHEKGIFEVLSSCWSHHCTTN